MKKNILIALGPILLVILGVTLFDFFHRPEGGLSRADQRRITKATIALIPDKDLTTGAWHVVPSKEPREYIVCGLVVSDLLQQRAYTPMWNEDYPMGVNAVFWAIYNTRLSAVRDIAIFGVNMGFEEFGDRCLRYQR